MFWYRGKERFSVLYILHIYYFTMLRVQLKTYIKCCENCIINIFEYEFTNKPFAASSKCYQSWRFLFCFTSIFWLIPAWGPVWRTARDFVCTCKKILSCFGNYVMFLHIVDKYPISIFALALFASSVTALCEAICWNREKRQRLRCIIVKVTA